MEPVNEMSVWAQLDHVDDIQWRQSLWEQLQPVASCLGSLSHGQQSLPVFRCCTDQPSQGIGPRKTPRYLHLLIPVLNLS